MTAAREDLQALVAESLREVAYTCTRTWEAWQYGTMTDEDFTPAWEDDELTGSMADEIVKAVAPRQITTVAELDALNRGDVVAQPDINGELIMVATRDIIGEWMIAGIETRYTSAHLIIPGWPALIVLHESTPAAAHG